MATKTWDEVYGEGATKPLDVDSREALTPSSLARLEQMTQQELISLIRRVSGAVWGYALLDDTEKAEAARLKLYNLGMSSTEVHKVMPALKEWFDRTSGKAPQSIAMKVEDNSLGKMATDKLLRLAAMLEEPVIIAPLPQKLED